MPYSCVQHMASSSFLEHSSNLSICETATFSGTDKAPLYPSSVGLSTFASDRDHW